ncbi:MAG: KUP/HAK/KT family potassium transporter [Syntrophobacteraceae bacterium]
MLAFRGSSGRAGAYGVAVTADMALTSVVYFFVSTTNLGWPIRKALPPAMLFLNVIRPAIISDARRCCLPERPG